ncbi:MAG: peptidase M28 family protein [Alphaproteobacteria bacterium]|nr:MAG: peptidase M28 family protein [Alphaproteobacteria bacterium]
MRRFSFMGAATGVALALSSMGVSAEAPPVDADSIATATALRETALKSDLAWDLLEGLTTEVGQRLAGTAKEREAIDWAVARMQAMGFDKVWTEPVTVQHWERVSETAEIVGAHAQKLTVTALGKSVATPEGGVTAEIVPFATVEDLEAADPALVKGKIVFIANRMERHRDGSGYGPAVKARGAGASIAAGKGALAIVIRSIGTDSHRVPHTGGVTYKEDQPKIAAAALSNPDADQLERLLARGKPVKLHLDIQTVDHGPVESANVIGEITGSERPDELVLIGGHIDSWDLGTGAIDDASGCALTMAAAKLIADQPDRPRRTIRVVLFAAEEPGLVGARAYAAAHEKDLDKHVIGAESDFGAGRIWALKASVNPEALPVIDTMAQLMGPLDVVRLAGTAHGGPDVGQMARLGMPAVDLEQDGTDYFDLHHTADDTLDKVDPAALKQNLAAWVVFSYLAADWPGSFK